MGKQDKGYKLWETMRLDTGGYRCPQCGMEADMDKHNIIPVKMDGSYAWRCTGCGFTWLWTRGIKRKV